MLVIIQQTNAFVTNDIPLAYRCIGLFSICEGKYQGEGANITEFNRGAGHLRHMWRLWMMDHVNTQKKFFITMQYQDFDVLK